MKRFKRILVATDTRFEHHPIVEEAAEIASQNEASLKICDVVPEFTWTVRLTLKDHEHMRELIAEEKQEKLNALAKPIRAKGIDVETKVLMGQTSVEIIREVLRGEHDLVLRVAKGTDSARKGFFGNSAIQLLRKCPCAVWLVTPETTPKFEHVLGCVDTSSGDALDAELNDNVYDLASSISHYQQGRFSIVHVWQIWNEQMIKGRMKSEVFAQFEENNFRAIKKNLATFLEKHGTTVDESNIHLLKGEPPILIPEFVRHNGVDLVVMGTVARSGLAGVLMGNTAELILSRINCSVLALKPGNFVSPITLE